MARDFSGSGEYLSGSFVPGNISNYPFTMAVWVRMDSVGSDAVIWELVDISGSNIKQRLYFRSSGADFWAQSRNPTSAFAMSTGTVTANTWHHACGVFTLANSRACFQDGANKGTNSTSISFDSNIDSTVIGGYGNSGVFNTNFNGKLAEAAIWDAALDDFEVAALGKGYSPKLIRPGNLVGYWPIIGRSSPEIDLAEGNDLTVNGTPDAYAHPKIIRPKRQIWIPVSTVAGPITGTGALAASDSSISGTGTVVGTITGSGALTAQDSSISGTGEITKTGTGALTADDSSISGTGTITKTGTGALAAGDSSISGTGTVTPAAGVSGSGALVADDSSISGTGTITKTGTGALAADDAAISGTGTITRTGTGALVADDSTISGTGVVNTTITGSGALVAGDCSISGRDVVVLSAEARINRYSPTDLSPEYNPAQLMDELRRIRATLDTIMDGYKEVLFVEPSTKRDGMTVVADGSEWDPGEGAGTYMWMGTSWAKQ